MALPGWNRLDLYPFDDGGARTAMQRALEALHAFLVAFDNRFHPAVRQVPGVPGEILGACLVLGEKPEADSLHAP